MEYLKALYRFFSSLKLSVFLLGFSLILVFFGTLDQVHYGIYETQRRYFQSIIAFWHYPSEWQFGDVLGFLVLPMPGGYLIGPLFLVNLVVSHFKYFKMRWRGVGIAFIHGGFVLLLLGQLFTDVLQEDFQMWIDEGGTSRHAESFHDNELVIVETTDAEVDKVTSIPSELLGSGRVFEGKNLPFSIRIQRFMLNARIMRLEEGQNQGLVKTSRGVGSRMRLGLIESAPTYKQNSRNATTAVIDLVGEEGSVGTWIVSNVFDGQVPSQRFQIGDRSFEVSLRFKRKYFPFDIELHDFTHDRYEGTDIPKNFSSKVLVNNRETGEKREALIYMNHPLRYGGYTFYQASFGKEDTSSMLQVVRNPGWLLPYLSCFIMSLGMVIQFGWSLVLFAGRSRK